MGNNVDRFVDAARTGDKDLLVKTFVKYSEDFNIDELDSSKHSESALHAAVFNNQEEVVRFLIGNSADINLCTRNQRVTPLIRACQRNSQTTYETLAVLISCKADVNAQDLDGIGALHCALRNKSNAVVQLLLDNEADVNMRTKTQLTPLMSACFYNSKTTEETITLLINADGNVNARDESGFTALHCCCHRGNLKKTKLFVKHGANLSLKTKVERCYPYHVIPRGCIPIDIARIRGHKEVLDYLMSIQFVSHRQRRVSTHGIARRSSDFRSPLDGKVFLAECTDCGTQNKAESRRRHKHLPSIPIRCSGCEGTFMTTNPRYSNLLNENEHDATRTPSEDRSDKKVSDDKISTPIGYNETATGNHMDVSGMDPEYPSAVILPSPEKHEAEASNTSGCIVARHNPNRDKIPNKIAASQVYSARLFNVRETHSAENIIDELEPGEVPQKPIFDEIQAMYQELKDPQNLKFQYMKLEEFQGIGKIGEGFFSYTFSARLGDTVVVIKAPKIKSTKGDAKEFEILLKLPQCENVLTVLGLCGNFSCTELEEERVAIVVPFQKNKDLKFHLKTLSNLDENTYINVALGMSRGIEHLHKNNIIHRDIALRNFLVSDKCRILISDFGLSRMVEGGSHDVVYYGGVGSKFPLRWCAPETLLKRKSTQMSDIWMFGVTILELFEDPPFKDITEVQVIAYISDPDFVLKLPNECPGLLKNIAQLSCQKDPLKRPAITDIIEILLGKKSPDRSQAHQGEVRDLEKFLIKFNLSSLTEHLINSDFDLVLLRELEFSDVVNGLEEDGVKMKSGQKFKLRKAMKQLKDEHEAQEEVCGAQAKWGYFQ